MAVLPDTTTGTITLTSGSVNFTTVGTQMQTRGHLPGDFIMHNGFMLVIATITGENTGTLRDVCPAGAAGSAVPVRIRFQSDGSRVAAQTRNLIDLLDGGTLQSLAGLALENNKLIKAIGPNTLGTQDFAQWAQSLLALPGIANRLPYIGANANVAELTAFTAFARSLLADANAAAMRATLDANNAANLTTGILPNARIGNDLTPDKAFRRGNILGNVAQSGGVPTGALIEQGSNANGDYVRFAGGLQICTCNTVVTDQALNIALGSLWQGIRTLTFPSPFVGSPTAAVGHGRWGTAGGWATVAAPPCQHEHHCPAN